MVYSTQMVLWAKLWSYPSQYHEHPSQCTDYNALTILAKGILSNSSRLYPQPLRCKVYQMECRREPMERVWILPVRPRCI